MTESRLGRGIVAPVPGSPVIEQQLQEVFSSFPSVANGPDNTTIWRKSLQGQWAVKGTHGIEMMVSSREGDMHARIVAIRPSLNRRKRHPDVTIFDLVTERDSTTLDTKVLIQAAKPAYGTFMRRHADLRDVRVDLRSALGSKKGITDVIYPAKLDPALDADQESLGREFNGIIEAMQPKTNLSKTLAEVRERGEFDYNHFATVALTLRTLRVPRGEAYDSVPFFDSRLYK